MADPLDSLNARMEPGAGDVPSGDVSADWSAAALVSIAISLKRIADAVSAGGTVDRLAAVLDPENPDGFLRASINCYGEGIGEALQGQLVRGQRGIDQYEGR